MSLCKTLKPSSSNMILEREFSKKVRAKCLHHYWYSFESMGNGVPDLYAIRPSERPFWVELKVLPSFNCIIPFRKGQLPWIHKHIQEGGRVHILCFCITEQSLVLIPTTGKKIIGLPILRSYLDAIKNLRVCDILKCTQIRPSVFPLSAPDAWERLSKSF